MQIIGSRGIDYAIIYTEENTNTIKKLLGDDFLSVYKSTTAGSIVLEFVSGTSIAIVPLGSYLAKKLDGTFCTLSVEEVEDLCANNSLAAFFNSLVQL